MIKIRSFRQIHAYRFLTIVATLLPIGTTATEIAAATALGVVRNSAGMVSIDFDVPRYGPLCVSVDEGDDLEFAWEEYHNLHQLPNEASFRDCDFSEAVALAPEGNPMPMGYQVEVTEEVREQYFACSKICASNGHKVKVCVGGSIGQANGCTTECKPDRTIDVRTTIGYVPVGRVCRPKNADGYAIFTGVDTPESCRRRCDKDFPRCGAWEFENYALDDKECELHERSVVSYNETLAMGDCQILTNSSENDDSYRCCWIAKDVVEAQTGITMGDADALSGSSSPFGWFKILAISIPTIVTLFIC